MADRKATKTGVPEDPREIVELDKDERWQARLEEARARREIALREKAANPKKKQRVRRKLQQLHLQTYPHLQAQPGYLRPQAHANQQTPTKGGQTWEY